MACMSQAEIYINKLFAIILMNIIISVDGTSERRIAAAAVSKDEFVRIIYCVTLESILFAN